MSIFRDRIVLSDGTVIMPDEITRLEPCFMDGVYIRTSTSNWCVHGGQFRTDRATGMDTLSGPAFERDEVDDGCGHHGHIIYEDGCFYVKWAETNMETSLLCDDARRLTITGMVPWEES